MNINENNQELINSTSLDFLTNEYILNTCLELDLHKNIPNLLVDLKNTILKDNSLKLLFKTYFSVYFNNATCNIPLTQIPLDKRDLFHLLVAIAKTKDTKKFYEENNLPLNIYYDTLSDINIWVNNNENKTGNIGLVDLNWLRHHLNGELFKIGRLQYFKVPFSGDAMLFRQVSTGYPLLLSYGDIKYDFLGNKTEENEDFISTFIESDITITANPIREGKCQSHALTINKCDYSLEIKRTTPLLGIHIPQGESLDISQCIDSMKDAIKFYYKYFNGEVMKGFSCSSWLLNRNFRDILPENSNIRKFSSMFYEYPSIQSDDQMYARVFNEERDLEKLDTINSKSVLQSSIINGLKQGLTFEKASIVFPSYDMRKLEAFRYK